MRGTKGAPISVAAATRSVEAVEPGGRLRLLEPHREQRNGQRKADADDGDRGDGGRERSAVEALHSGFVRTWLESGRRRTNLVLWEKVRPEAGVEGLRGCTIGGGQ